jgi:hypothetical protein
MLAALSPATAAYNPTTVVWFPTIASLRAYPSGAATQTQTISLQGAASAGDNGQGSFVWSPTSAAADDGMNVIKPSDASGNGRWLRVLALTALRQSGEPTATSDLPHGFQYGTVVVNTTPNTSPGTGRVFVNVNPASGAAVWGGLGYYDSVNNYWAGRGVFGNACTSCSLNIGIGFLALRNVTTATSDLAIGQNALTTCLSCTEAVAIGEGALQSEATSNGDIAIGQNCFQTKNAPGGFPNTWSVCIGNDAATNIVQIGSSVVIGRGALFNATTFATGVAAVGHGSLFNSDNLNAVDAFGDSAGGGPVTGGTGPFGAINDNNASYLGTGTGKACITGLTDVAAIGPQAVVGCHNDEVVVGGPNVVALSTPGKLLDKWASVTVTNGAGTTLTAANLIAGRLVRSGPGAAFTDTTDTAAAIVQALGGNGMPLAGLRVSIINSSGFAMTIAGGTNVFVSGAAGGGVVNAGANAMFRVQVSNSTAGSESISISREI